MKDEQEFGWAWIDTIYEDGVRVVTLKNGCEIFVDDFTLNYPYVIFYRFGFKIVKVMLSEITVIENERKGE